MGTLVKWHVIRALVKRDVRIYFTNPSGYMFITLFIFLSAATAFWQERFFLSNLANLNQLTQLFPQLLMLFIPALTMSVWSEERKLGTDELLLTLPATDFEVVLGKYLSVLAVYTASLALSLSHVAVLSWLGSPDLGLMFGNYLGFWLLGAALIAVGMLGSLLTANIAIAFALGAVLCALLVFVDVAAAVFSPTWQRIVAPLGVVSHFRDFSDGVVSLSALLYFLSVTGSFLYLNVLIVGRRHWLPPSGGLSMGAHHAVRALAAVTLVVCVNAVVARASARLDVTAERLHTLTDQTHQLLGELSAERPVLIRAFISPTVPEAYVQTRATLLGLLREIDVLAGPNVQLLIEETEPYTDAAVDAQDTFGITARPVPDLSGGRAAFTDVFLGVAFTCGAEEQVIPFFDRGLPAEYEIARSIRVVAQTERKTVGVVNTAVRLFGGLDFQTMRSTPSWSIVAELRKQYDVVEITPSGPITEELDGVVVVLPSSLTQDQMDHVQAYIEEGHPALLLVDPLPVVNIGLAPSEQPGGSRNPFMAQNQPPPLPKGNVQGLLADLGVRWDSSAVAWDAYNPHPDLAHLPPEVIFVGEGSDSNAPFNQEHRASAGLQELVVLYPGHIGEAATSDYEFVPLLSSGPLSGVLSYFQMVQRSFFGTQLNPALPHQPSRAQYILAAHVTGTKEVVVAESSDEESPEDPAGEPDEEGEGDDVGEETAEGNAAGAAGNGVDSTAAPSEPTPADSAPIEDAVDDAPSGEEVEPDVDSAASDAPTEATTSSDGAVTPEPAEPPDQASVVGPGPASAERGTTGEQTAGFTPEGSAPENRSEGPVASSDDRATTAEPQPVSEVARAAPTTAPRAPAATATVAEPAEVTTDEAEPAPGAQVGATSAGDAAPTPDEAEGEDAEGEELDPVSGAATTASVDVIVIADLDFISQQFFDIRRAGPENLNFDNISFFLNCIDVLVDDESFIELRRRRVQHRTLSRVEQQTQTFIEQRASEEQQAESEAEQALAEAQQRLNERVQDVRDRPDLDDRTKQIMARNLEEVENRRFDVLEANIEAEKEAKIQRSRRNMESQIRQIQSAIRTLAVLLPPIPVFALGGAVFIQRARRERESAAAARRLRS